MKDTKYLWTKISRICLFLTVFFFIQAIISFFYIRQFSHTQIQRKLTNFNGIVKKDLIYNNGTWDLSRYTSDPRTPHPQGSSGFPHPLYIVTSEGFIIERNQPITGFMDSSDFDKIRGYTQPTTLKTVTNENWRIQARSIQSNGKLFGDVVVAYYNEQNRQNSEIDAKLQANLELLSKKIQLENGKMNVNKVDIRDVHYDVSFEIVDDLNTVLLNNGRMPTFIDRSHVSEQGDAQTVRIIKDANTREDFLVVSDKIVDKNGTEVAIVVSAQSIQELQQILKAYLVYAGISGLLLLLPFSWIMLEYIQSVAKSIIKDEEIRKNRAPIFNKIQFNKKESLLKLNEKEIRVPYASNQYYILSVLFSNPKKRWEQDEIMEKFGSSETPEEGWRKVYDAHLAINRKVGFKLIDYRDKLFRINPDFLTAITSP